MVQALSLAELENFDPGGGRGGRERRFCCPLCHGDRRRDGAHRSLSVNGETGAWYCHRCGESGALLSDGRGPAVKSRRPRRRYISRPLTPSPGETKRPTAAEWREHLHGVVPLADTPGETYLVGRGIPIEVARSAQVRYHPCYFGRPAALFPIRDLKGELVAVQGRYVDSGSPKCRTIGSKRLGIFRSTPEALEADPLVITEAPIDALTLAAEGVPAIALCGTSAPPWLAEVSAFRRVVLALDGDETGDRATSELATELGRYGACLSRLKPPEGYKDWNAATGNLHLPAALFETPGPAGRVCARCGGSAAVDYIEVPSGRLCRACTDALGIDPFAEELGDPLPLSALCQPHTHNRPT